MEAALRSGLPRPIERLAQRELARLAKRGLDYARATSLWENLRETTSATKDKKRIVLGEGVCERRWKQRLKQPNNWPFITSIARSSQLAPPISFAQQLPTSKPRESPGKSKARARIRSHRGSRGG